MEEDTHDKPTDRDLANYVQARKAALLEGREIEPFERWLRNLPDDAW